MDEYIICNIDLKVGNYNQDETLNKMESI